MTLIGMNGKRFFILSLKVIFCKESFSNIIFFNWNHRKNVFTLFFLISPQASRIAVDSRAVLDNAKKSINLSTDLEKDVIKWNNNSSELVNIARVYVDETMDNIDVSYFMVTREQIQTYRTTMYFVS